MQQDASAWGSVPADPSGSPGEEGAPGLLGADAAARAHALVRLVAEVAETSRQVEACRTDPSWSGRAHDAFTAALDDLAAQVARAQAELRTAHDADAPAPGFRGGRR